jgi:hypothetical protein
MRSGGRTLAAPPPDRRVAASDVLYLLGDPSDIQLARARLAHGPRRRGDA